MLPVGSLKPNDFGLFDMLGNAMEWCQDKERYYYPTDRPLVEDAEQVGVVRDSENRVLRGGSFVADAPLCGRPTATTISRTTGSPTSVSAWRGLTPDLLYRFSRPQGPCRRQLWQPVNPRCSR